MEENKKGQNTLYAVIGVATLVVAIIGATFAYFSAQAVATGDPIEGKTNDVGGALTLNVSKVNFFDEDATDKPESDDLIPADLGLAGEVPTAAELDDILNAKCVGGEGDAKYTGCHVYKISASATQTLSAKLLLQSFTVSAKDKASWNYILFKKDKTSEERVSSEFTPVIGTFKSTDYATHPDPLTEDDTIRGKEIETFTIEGNSEENPTEYVYDYYLLIYLANKEGIVQNNKDDETNNGVGQYSGSVLLDAGDGSGLVASFNHS